MGENARSIIIFSVPHIGLSKYSARGLALDQFAWKQRYEAFAESSVHYLDQALQISEEVFESDSIDVVANQQDFSGLLSSASAYQVVVRLRRAEHSG